MELRTEHRSEFHFCRFTELGLLRLVTAEAVMAEDVMSPRQAWAAYDRWLEDDRVLVIEEPPGLDRRFRALTRMNRAAPRSGPTYLAAFAEMSQMTLVTFDRSLGRKAAPVILLEEASDEHERRR